MNSSSRLEQPRLTQKREIVIAHLNVRGLLSSADELKIFTNNHSVVVSVKLGSTVMYQPRKLRRDRESGNGGGFAVFIYCKQICLQPSPGLGILRARSYNPGQKTSGHLSNFWAKSREFALMLPSLYEQRVFFFRCLFCAPPPPPPPPPDNVKTCERSMNGSSFRRP